ncbi:DUF4249 family protein [Aquimarina algiphila]|uniref:DUF4249 family protein n=1 Tax=Aquimarina algiphila TaxID=2047982 RepID=UPI00232E85D7|nr:DUF4249 domain-containing protein [Aquimarina algiphila]
MRKVIYIAFGILFFMSCEDVVDIDVPEGEPKLVIDASLEFVTQTDGSLRLENEEIKLTMSAPFFDENTPTVSDATIYITNLTFDFIYNFDELSFEPGTYIPSNGSFLWDFESDYELTVIHNNETYKATTKIIPSVPIDNVIQGDGTLFEGNEIEIEVSFTDDGNRDDFYLFDFDFSLFLPSEDRFYQGKSFKFSYFYENPEEVEGREITIKILGIDQRYFNYSSILIEQSEQDGGNPFQAPPAVLRGNIINTTNSDNYPLGYFNLSETYSFPFTIQKK